MCQGLRWQEGTSSPKKMETFFFFKTSLSPPPLLPASVMHLCGIYMQPRVQLYMVHRCMHDSREEDAECPAPLLSRLFLGDWASHWTWSLADHQQALRSSAPCNTGVRAQNLMPGFSHKS